MGLRRGSWHPAWREPRKTSAQRSLFKKDGGFIRCGLAKARCLEHCLCHSQPRIFKHQGETAVDNDHSWGKLPPPLCAAQRGTAEDKVVCVSKRHLSRMFGNTGTLSRSKRASSVRHAGGKAGTRLTCKARRTHAGGVILRGSPDRHEDSIISTCCTD